MPPSTLMCACTFPPAFPTLSSLVFGSLTGFFEARFGAKGSEGFRQAQRRFIESLAAYSIACYLLQIKDRWVPVVCAAEQQLSHLAACSARFFSRLWLVSPSLSARRVPTSCFWFESSPSRTANQPMPATARSFPHLHPSFLDHLSWCVCVCVCVCVCALAPVRLLRRGRHNGNILLDAHGHVIHVDFGFMLANSPGGNLGFESAPFKLTQGFLNLMGGTQSRCFRDFQGLCVDAFLALRRSSQVCHMCVRACFCGIARANRSTNDSTVSLIKPGKKRERVRTFLEPSKGVPRKELCGSFFFFTTNRAHRFIDK